MAWEYGIVPYDVDGEILSCYSRGTTNETLSAQLAILTGKSIHLTRVEAGELEPLLMKYYPRGEEGGKESRFLNVSDDFLTRMINEAKMLGSSDIHIETYEHRCRVRFRVDGKLVERYAVNHEEYPSLINKIKIRANLDIAEKRLPQDGRINHAGDQEPFDIRVSILPTLEGEKVVLRLLAKNVGETGLSTLGFNKEQFQLFRQAISKPNGIILISGPTGSGKTTTLYATLREINKEELNVVTIEDPVEYTLEGINQVPVRESIGMDYAIALKTFLRQDPDVIMLGEIRDGETARMAIRAALTGHLVLSTIHTNSAWGTITRLLDMEIPPYLVANTLNLSVAQRLVRLLCPACKRIVARGEGDSDLERYLDADITRYAVPTGCKQCFYTGYKGRRAVYELVPVDPEVRECIKRKGEAAEEVLQAKKVLFLREGMLELTRSLQTSPEEIASYLLS
ncbi:MAG: GspE/PulE family protein [Odoribacteraceae bacterium]|jgi:general secretion pathway protein E/type IV pilus assembly protein PilB|nr:GspE/PulE family protein [Odoribacteraceae bacterium]